MKVGDKVVFIGDEEYDWPFKKGGICVIYQIFECRCGRILFDVGVSCGVEFSGTDCSCGNIVGYTPDDGIWWAYSTSFAPIEYNSAQKELCKFVEEKLDVEIKEPQL